MPNSPVRWPTLFSARIPGVGRGLFEACVAAEEHKIQVAGWPVALFRNDYFRLGSIFFRHVRLVKVRAVDEKDHVRILLDRARFPQIGKLWLAILALGSARQLAEHHIPFVLRIPFALWLRDADLALCGNNKTA